MEIAAWSVLFYNTAAENARVMRQKSNNLQNVKKHDMCRSSENQDRSAKCIILSVGKYAQLQQVLQYTCTVQQANPSHQ